MSSPIATRSPPPSREPSPEAHRKAADYTVARTRFSRVAAAWDAVALLGLTVGGGLEALAHLLPGRTLLGATAYVLAAFLGYELLLLPLALWRTFRIEQRFGFNRTTPGLFAADLLKGLALGAVIGGGIACGALKLISGGGRFWWLFAWAGWVAVSVLLAWAYPVLIAPLFNRFRPLADETLRQRIQALLDRTGFRSGGILVMDGSRRSTHANAYFTGLGRRKRVVFFDTLREMLTPDEIEAVLAHELAPLQAAPRAHAAHRERRHLARPCRALRVAPRARVVLRGVRHLDAKAAGGARPLRARGAGLRLRPEPAARGVVAPPREPGGCVRGGTHVGGRDGGRAPEALREERGDAHARPAPLRLPRLASAGAAPHRAAPPRRRVKIA